MILTAALGCLGCAAVAYAATINGTGGPETIIGTTRGDNIDAKAGLDTVIGLSGNDRIKGGAGDDAIQADGTCPPGAQDLESCDQTRGTGNDGIYGGSGSDTLFGNVGNDTIAGGLGRDNLLGSAGDDRIYARDRERDSINCGSGRDTVFANRADSVSRNCERVHRTRR